MLFFNAFAVIKKLGKSGTFFSGSLRIKTSLQPCSLIYIHIVYAVAAIIGLFLLFNLHHSEWPFTGHLTSATLVA